MLSSRTRTRSPERDLASATVAERRTAAAEAIIEMICRMMVQLHVAVSLTSALFHSIFLR
jgi:hypothetical protein